MTKTTEQVLESLIEELEILIRWGSLLRKGKLPSFNNLVGVDMDNKNNTGIDNSGNWNSGYGNSGNWNSGNWNSGYGNSTNRSTGIFCTTEKTVRMFNKETNLMWDDIDHPYFYEFSLNKWVPKNEMTVEEKKENPEFNVIEGYLKTFTWEEAWSNYWRDADDEERQKVLNLPNFNADIFKEITGIDVKQTQEDFIIKNGKKYRVQILEEVKE